ncbi:MAG: YqaJ viral recombinase family protein [Ruminococcus sp.]|nr:YqaJ viral recombinase family protein [Ruminococcus sp.]
MILTPEDREEWLEARHRGIGGSDAGAVIGANKYRSNVDLWREKTGRVIPEDISDKPAVKFGKFAERHLRELFRLDYPDYGLDYHEFFMYVCDDAPFIFATLDGELTDLEGRRGILEIKTTTIQNRIQWDDWEDGVPQSYYVQVLHQLAATGWDFALIMAYIRYYKDGTPRAAVRYYRIERSDVEEEIAWLIHQEEAFWEHVRNDTEPALILPEI